MESKRLQKKNAQKKNASEVDYSNARQAVGSLLEFITNATASQERLQFAQQNGLSSVDTKHCGAWGDYGYPEILEFMHYFTMFERFGTGEAAVMRHPDKTWQTDPKVLEGDVVPDKKAPHEPTSWEKEFAELAKRLDLWRILYGADWRNRVGRYAGLLLITRGTGEFNTPMKKLPGPDALLKIMPLYESQLKVQTWNTDQNSERYSQPIMYQLKETALGDRNPQSNSNIEVHYSRVFIWAEGADDGSIYGKPALKSVFNSLITLEKIVGAGGEGFWKNARASLSMVLEKDGNIQSLATALGTDIAGLPDELNDMVKDWAAGFDKNLMLQGMDVKPLAINLPDPKPFADVALNDIAAGLNIPATILIGQQTGRLASDEDQADWCQSIESRRNRFAKPTIHLFIEWLILLNVVKPVDNFVIDWESLLSPSLGEKLDDSKKMSEINKNSVGTGQPVPYSSEQIVEVSGLEPDMGEVPPSENVEDDDFEE